MPEFSDYQTPPSKQIVHYTADSKRYDEMIYQRCGRSGLKLPRICLGLWQNFGDTDPFQSSRAMIFRAFDLGITHFDFGNNYGRPPGSAEETFGRVLSKDLKSYRDELVIATKAGYDMWPGPYGEWGSKKYLVASLNASLKRLKLDYVDIFYSHRFDPDTPLEETMGALDTLVRQGKALYVGLSSYSPSKTEEAVRILKSLGTPCLVHQSSYSMFNRWVESELLSYLETAGIGFMAFSPLAQGLLSQKYRLSSDIKEGRANAVAGSIPKEQLNIEVRKSLEKLDLIATARGQTLSQMAISWALRDSKVTCVVMGARNIKQIEENVASLKNLNFSSSELEEIDLVAKDMNIDLWKSSRDF